VAAQVIVPALRSLFDLLEHSREKVLALPPADFGPLLNFIGAGDERPEHFGLSME